MLLSDFIRDGAARLENLYPSPEARGLVLMLCRELLGVTNYTHIVEPQTLVPAEREAELSDALARLYAGEPIQNVLGYTEFCDRRFAVGPGVLIPRPETELLVAEAVRTLREMDLDRPPRVLDLCTGSGCIAWSIALEIRDAEVVGVDLSETALRCAQGQFPTQYGGISPEPPAAINPFPTLLTQSPGASRSADADFAPLNGQATPLFLQADVLDTEQEFEGLFVPDDDPLRFYRAIARWAQRFLRPGGVGLVEINEALGPNTAAVFSTAGYKNVQTLPDFYKKIRFVRFSA